VAIIFGNGDRFESGNYFENGDCVVRVDYFKNGDHLLEGKVAIALQ
jgi:hypothetical protein